MTEPGIARGLSGVKNLYRRFTHRAPRSPRAYYQDQQRRGAAAPIYPLREKHEHGPDPRGGQRYAPAQSDRRAVSHF